jgi:hypothetical protein
MLEGRLVPLLGAGVNRCGRPDGSRWQSGRYLPDGGELARHLAHLSAYPDGQQADLVRVSQYFELMLGLGALYDELRAVLDSDYPATPVHRLLARLPALRRAAGLGTDQLIITTNYDDALERALRDAREEFELVTYLAVGPSTGLFQHTSPDGQRRVIERPNEYADLRLTGRTIILKLHGAVDRADPDSDSYVITEDDYIDYLALTDLSCLLPVTLAAKLKRSHFLFLGYSLGDWNLRVILRRIWGQQRLRYRSWAVQLHSEEIDRRFWDARGVDILDMRLEDYVRELYEQLAEQLQESHTASERAQFAEANRDLGRDPE